MVSPANIFISLKIALSELERHTQAFLAALPTSLSVESDFHYTSPQALTLPKDMSDAPFASLRSGLPVTCAPAPGQMAQLEGEKLSGLLPATRYAFPLLVFALTGPQGQSETLEVMIPPFQTFREGVLERHLLEFVVTLLDLDLQPWGFRALRKDVQIVISATPEYAGWNIAIQDLLLMPMPPQTQICHLGLKVGLSSTDPGQIAGLPPTTAWGKYRLNGAELTLFQTHAPQPELKQVREALTEQCNAALASTGIGAWIDPEGHLLFKARHPDLALELVRLPEPEWPTGTLLQALDLPEGRIEPPPVQQNSSELPLGRLRVNGQECDLGQIPLRSASQVRADLAQRFEALSVQTSLQLWLDEAGFLHFKGREIELEPLSPGPWELESVQLKASASDKAPLSQAFEGWIQAANHCLRQVQKNTPLKPLELPLRQALLAQMPGQMGVQVSLTAETGLQLNARPHVLLEHFEQISEALQRYLRQLPTHLHNLLTALTELEQKPAETAPQLSSSPVMPVIQPAPPVFTAPPFHAEAVISPRPAALLQEEEEEPPEASFDHKI